MLPRSADSGGNETGSMNPGRTASNEGEPGTEVTHANRLETPRTGLVFGHGRVSSSRSPKEASMPTQRMTEPPPDQTCSCRKEENRLVGLSPGSERNSKSPWIFQTVFEVHQRILLGILRIISFVHVRFEIFGNPHQSSRWAE